MIDLTKPLFALYPTAKWTLNGDDYSGLTWLSEDILKPTEAELLSWVDPNAYKAKRAAEYPPIGDQLDALFHAGVFPSEMAALIQAVKTKYPKA